MTAIPYHEIARAERAARLGLPADPAALVALLERDATARDDALAEVTEERDSWKGSVVVVHAMARKAGKTLRAARDELAALSAMFDGDEAMCDASDKVHDALDELDAQLDAISTETAV